MERRQLTARSASSGNGSGEITPTPDSPLPDRIGLSDVRRLTRVLLKQHRADILRVAVRR
jgi:hypothetical protein